MSSLGLIIIVFIFTSPLVSFARALSSFVAAASELSLYASATVEPCASSVERCNRVVKCSHILFCFR